MTQMIDGYPLDMDERSPEEVYTVFNEALAFESESSLANPKSDAVVAMHVGEAQFRIAQQLGLSQEVAAWDGLRTRFSERQALISARHRAGVPCQQVTRAGTESQASVIPLPRVAV